MMKDNTRWGLLLAALMGTMLAGCQQEPPSGGRPEPATAARAITASSGFQIGRVAAGGAHLRRATSPGWRSGPGGLTGG